MEKDKSHIIEKVKELYSRYGIKSVTMDDVSRELGMSKKTLYEHVKDKKELVQAVVDYTMEELSSKIAVVINSQKNAIQISIDIQQEIAQFMSNQNPSVEYDLKKYYPDIYEKAHNKERDNMQKATIENMKIGKAEGWFRADLNIDVVSTIILSLSEMHFKEHIDNLAKDYTHKEIFYEIFSYHLRGICSPKGLEFLNTHFIKS